MFGSGFIIKKSHLKGEFQGGFLSKIDRHKGIETILRKIKALIIKYLIFHF